ncbi:MAG: 50S ribosomal protein L11 methyltransferase [Thermoflexus sp.]|uniref:50S ribosomal protein L11 methyltransferase n=1 Tax=Thermoflexus sp. TaxID=1969742 RepID=UPI00331B81E4
MRWLEISVQVPTELADPIAEVLSRYVPHGIAFDYGPPPAVETDWERPPPPPPVLTVRAYLPMTEGWEAARHRIEEGFWHLRQILPFPPPEFRVIDETAWEEAWKAHYDVLRVGSFVIKPSWREAALRPGELLIELDPGMAFGTGTHPTTRLCLQALAEWLEPGSRILDLGTGSGILAIAAARKGAAVVWALDIDPVAVRVAQENVRRNGVADRVHVREGSLEAARALGEPFDGILANILAPVIVRLCAEGLGDRVRPGGWVVASGFFAGEQEEAVGQAMAAAGLRVRARWEEDGWVALGARKE